MNKSPGMQNSSGDSAGAEKPDPSARPRPTVRDHLYKNIHISVKSLDIFIRVVICLLVALFIYSAVKR
jgi:hypothetical protein